MLEAMDFALPHTCWPYEDGKEKGQVEPTVEEPIILRNKAHMEPYILKQACGIDLEFEEQESRVRELQLHILNGKLKRDSARILQKRAFEEQGARELSLHLLRCIQDDHCHLTELAALIEDRNSVLLAWEENFITKLHRKGTQNDPVENSEYFDLRQYAVLSGFINCSEPRSEQFITETEITATLGLDIPEILCKALQLQEGTEQRKLLQYNPLQLTGWLESLDLLLLDRVLDFIISLILLATYSIFKMASLFFWLQVQLFNIWQSSDHTRCILNICARFIYHDECWGFTSAGEWLRPHEHVNDKTPELFVCSVPPVVVHTAWPF